MNASAFYMTDEAAILPAEHANLMAGAFAYLHITWWRDDGGVSVQKYYPAMLRGMALIDSYAGRKCNYMEDMITQSLLFDYLRYVRSDATEVFEHNFRCDLIALRMGTEEADETETAAESADV